VVGAGPQLGFIIPLTTETQGYLNLKSYWEFANHGYFVIIRLGEVELASEFIAHDSSSGSRPQRALRSGD
jgi:hypothetical protein